MKNTEYTIKDENVRKLLLFLKREYPSEEKKTIKPKNEEK